MVFYAITDQRILVRKGLRGQTLIALPLEQMGSYRFLPQGEFIGTARIFPAGSEGRLTLSCIEHPQGATTLLDAALATAVAGRPDGSGSGEIV
jgi:hypothetical protein